MTFYRRTGELILGTRLRRLSERILADVSRVYREMSIPFETSWFPLFHLLHERGSLSVTEVARDAVPIFLAWRDGQAVGRIADEDAVIFCCRRGEREWGQLEGE